MASVEGAKEGKTRRNSSDHLSFQDIVPSSGWSEDEKCHYLLVDLPGFKREEVKLQVDYQTNQLMASGERRVSELKYIRFKQTFKLPNNSDIEKITAKFEGEILYVIVPKVKEQKEEPKEENGTASTVAEENVNEKPNKGDDKQGENIDGERNKQCEGVDKVFKEKLGRDAGLLECVISKLRKNKGIVMTAVLAFSLGVFITRKFESGGE
ncbi:hypothetical protein VitviT2T_026094 [Vitis vinifera]|uniref:SHSP domain-containing protein n=1 Tax=Vitis vinifera TaxID=29760 RepID=A0ABY9DL21_VITVI|nr:17.6 kDa class I heat shock protein [Vitis vinifera]WKA08365.1 hypothetical protein VitviT2T_026094 [Vitis vinifera]|eukprot:XP_010663410.1 PREDICTED: 17.6 kDa class I heat shock protein [Vitis vinifera]